ncbi:hypothetical protein TNCV_3461481 [Trichonephila clavipes]|nr:hypothetical protein TNCV_3461481 [Trichonephila clavipes]
MVWATIGYKAQTRPVGVDSYLNSQLYIPQVLWSVVLSSRENTFCLRKKKGSGQSSVSEEAMERARKNFVRNPRKSTRVDACKLGMPQKTA